MAAARTLRTSTGRLSRLTQELLEWTVPCVLLSSFSTPSLESLGGKSMVPELVQVNAWRISMIRHSWVVLSLVATLYLASPTASVGQQGRTITEKDLFDFVWVADPQVSPDGGRVAFTRVIVDEKRTGYESSIWTVATNGKEPPVRMTNGKHDAQPRWSPDGN